VDNIILAGEATKNQWVKRWTNISHISSIKIHEFPGYKKERKKKLRL